MLILLILCAILSAANLAASLASYLRADNPARKAPEVAEAEPRRNGIDEGFENIMSYSVGGRTGFEEETWQ